MEDDFRASSKGVGFIESLDGEGASGGRLPFVEVVIVVLGLDAHAISHQVGRVETHAELTDHGNVGSSLKKQERREESGGKRGKRKTKQGKQGRKVRKETNKRERKGRKEGRKVRNDKSKRGRKESEG